MILYKDGTPEGVPFVLCLGLVIAAPLGDATLITMGCAGLAYVTAMKKYPMMCFRDKFSRDILDELLFCLQRILTIGGKPNALRYTEDVGIDCHGGLVVDDGTYNVGCLTAYAWETLQIFNIIGHLAIEIVYQHLCHTNEMCRLVVRVGDGTDVLKDGFFVAGCHDFGRWEGLKECGRDLIDTLIGTLGREHNRYEQFEGISVVEFAFGNGHGFSKVF